MQRCSCSRHHEQRWRLAHHRKHRDVVEEPQNLAQPLISLVADARQSDNHRVPTGGLRRLAVDWLIGLLID
jgi:hypothetical protein